MLEKAWFGGCCTNQWLKSGTNVYKSVIKALTKIKRTACPITPTADENVENMKDITLSNRQIIGDYLVQVVSHILSYEASFTKLLNLVQNC